MKDFGVSLFLVCILLRPALSQIGVDYEAGPRHSGKRFLQMARGELEELKRRLHSMTSYRIMHEESPHYEIGYVFGEILERYRKMMDVVKVTRVRLETFFHTEFHLETAQYLYMEIYHLIMMIHEVPIKYGDHSEFVFLKTYQQKRLSAEDQISPEEEFRLYLDMKKYYREQMRLKAKLAQLMDRYLQNKENQLTSVPKNDLWPMDYGWEIKPDWVNNTRPIGLNAYEPKSGR